MSDEESEPNITNEEDGGTMDRAMEALDTRHSEDASDDDFHHSTSPMAINFDRSLPTAHSYFGSDLQYVRARAIFEDFEIVKLTIIPVDTIVCPGYTLPITVAARREEVFDIINNQDRTFGAVCMYGLESHDHEHIECTIGVTLEIYEYTETTDGVRIKARGRQRFKIIDEKINYYNSMFHRHVQILPDLMMPSLLQNIQITSLNRFRLHSSNNDSFKLNKSLRMRDAIQTRWPLWVFDSYDVQYLIEKIKELLLNLGDIVPSEPTALSYWVIQNAMLQKEERLEALSINNVTHRLQILLYFLRQSREICCAYCHTRFAGVESLFPMSQDGIQNNYCNPSGVIHETITVMKVHSVELEGTSHTEFSWFPGYAWTIIVCSQCENSVGWKFTACFSDLQPKSFYGLTRSAISLRTKVEGQ